MWIRVYPVAVSRGFLGLLEGLCAQVLKTVCPWPGQGQFCGRSLRFCSSCSSSSLGSMVQFLLQDHASCYLSSPGHFGGFLILLSSESGQILKVHTRPHPGPARPLGVALRPLPHPSSVVSHSPFTPTFRFQTGSGFSHP